MGAKCSLVGFRISSAIVEERTLVSADKELSVENKKQKGSLSAKNASLLSHLAVKETVCNFTYLG